MNSGSLFMDYCFIKLFFWGNLKNFFKNFMHPYSRSFCRLISYTVIGRPALECCSLPTT